jgi:hypothetical protein
MAIAALAIRFVVELVGVGALANVGWQTGSEGIGRIALALAAPLALIIVWAIIVAPNADNPLGQPARDVIGTLLLVGIAGALATVGEPRLAAIFAAVVVIDWVAMAVLRPPEIEAFVSSSGARR